MGEDTTAGAEVSEGLVRALVLATAMIVVVIIDLAAIARDRAIETVVTVESRTDETTTDLIKKTVAAIETTEETTEETTAVVETIDTLDEK